MIANTTATVMIVMIMPVDEVLIELIRAEGRPAMMFVKMISDMPLPMPRWVTSSPSHMMMMAPVTMVTTR